MSKNVLRIIVGIVVVVVFGVVIAAKIRQSGKTEVKSGDICGPVCPASATTPAPAQSATGDARQPVPGLKQGLPAVLDFGRGQCIPCKAMKPILEELGKELAGKVAVKIIDVGEDRETAERFNINLIPTQVFLDAGGKEVYRHEGFIPKEDILTVLKEKGMAGHD